MLPVYFALRTMTRKFSAEFAFAGHLTLLALSGVAAASEVAIDEIQVTATRRTVKASEVSSALGVVNASEVQTEKLITDALDWQPGTSLQQTTPGQGSVILRGLKGSAVLHLVDGMRLSNAIFRSAPTPYLSLVPVSAVERVEVIRGTSASLYGSEAVGGTVMVVSRLPEFDSGLQRNIFAAADSVELARSVGAGVDFGGDHIAALASAEYLETGDRRTGGGARIGPSGYSATAFRAAIRAAGHRGDEWLLDLQFLEQPETPRIDELVPGFGQSQPSSSEFLFAPSQRWFAHAGYRRDQGLWGQDWRLDGAWQRVVDDRVSRDFGDVLRQHESNSSDLAGLSVNAAGSRDAWSWVVGLDAYHDEVSSARSETDIRDGSRIVVPSRFPDGSTIRQAALFGKIDRRLNERLLLSAGLRHTSVDIDLPDTAATAAAAISVRRPSGDFGLLFDASDELQLVANIGFGFRAPNVFDLGTLGARPGNRFNVPNTALDAESVTHGDMGLRWHAERLRVEIFVFALHYRDRITSVLTGEVSNEGREIVQSVNAANSKIFGIESGFQADLTERLQLHGVFNYTRGEDRQDGLPAEPADRIPAPGGRMALTWTRDDAWQFEGTLTAAARQHRLSERDIRDVRIDPDGTPGWATLGANGRWNGAGGWQLRFGIDNVFDRRYRQHGSGIDAPGRNIWLDIRRNW